MLSCDETPESLAGSLLAGADGYMVKGVFGRRLRHDVERIFRDPAGEGGAFHVYLRSRRLCLDQRSLLEAFAGSGYSLPKELGFDLGRSENSIQKSLARIRARLELDNNAQLVRLLTVLSGFGMGHGGVRNDSERQPWPAGDSSAVFSPDPGESGHNGGRAMKKMTMMVLCALAAAAFSLGAAAQEVSMEGVDEAEVDWEEAVYFAELVETYKNDDGEMINVFWDEEQRVMWDQPVDMTEKEALDELQGSSPLERIDTRIIPYTLTFCFNDSCTSSDVYATLAYMGVDGTSSYWMAMGAQVYSNNVDRIKASGRSYLNDYRTNWHGQYYDDGEWPNADNETTGSWGSTYYFYHLDESDDIDNWSYPKVNYHVARFIYKPSTTWYYSYVQYAVIE